VKSSLNRAESIARAASAYVGSSLMLFIRGFSCHPLVPTYIVQTELLRSGPGTLENFVASRRVHDVQIPLSLAELRQGKDNQLEAAVATVDAI
jgi:hypothetical protein